MTRNEKRTYWAGIVEEFNRSGFSAREFCQRRELSYQMLLRWKRQFEEKTELSPFAFTEILPIQKLSLSCSSLEISVDYDLPISTLAQVIQALNLASKNS